MWEREGKKEKRWRGREEEAETEQEGGRAGEERDSRPVGSDQMQWLGAH